MFSIKRSKNNPIIKPNPENEWESFATFNGCPVMVNKKINILYRALSKPKKFESSSFSLSTIGKAIQGIGSNWKVTGQFITPVEPWEKYGCEDPRVTYINGKYYTFYTALGMFPFQKDGIKVALAISKDLETIQERHLITPFNAKAMSLFPDKIGGKYTVIFAANTDGGQLAKISIAQFPKIEDIWDENRWKKWYENIDENVLKIPRKDNEQVEVGAPPIKTPFGWLLIYSHVYNYFSEDKVFGISAVLLDIKDPKKVIAQTKTPFAIPETQYEKEGILKNIVFPSGAILQGDKLTVFYGGADTVCASLELSFMGLVSSMEFFDKRSTPSKILLYKESHKFKRLTDEPILEPRKDYPWESRAVFNPASIDIDGTTYLLYRAMSEDNTSTMGCAELYDMKSVKFRSAKPVYIPRLPFEEKRVPNGNSGCEDPRITLLENRIYMTYTAFNGVELPHIALTSISINDFTSGIWKWDKPYIISNDNVDDKDGVIFPAKIKNKYALIHRVNHSICIDYSPTLEFKNRNQFKNNTILLPRRGMWDSKKVGIAMPPLLSKAGWILIYHGIGEDGSYRVGAALLDKDDVEKVISRTQYPIFEPEMYYEKNGQINEVVFPCGAVVKKDTIYIYYGGADSVVGVASIKIKNILDSLSNS